VKTLWEKQLPSGKRVPTPAIPKSIKSKSNAKPKSKSQLSSNNFSAPSLIPLLARLSGSSISSIGFSFPSGLHPFFLASDPHPLFFAGDPHPLFLVGDPHPHFLARVAVMGALPGR
jgi:hypothetical protein